jgi:hypothetical protein
MSLPRNFNEIKAAAARAGVPTRNEDALTHPSQMGIDRLSASEIADLPNWEYVGPIPQTRRYTAPNGEERRIRGLVAILERTSTLPDAEASATMQMYCSGSTLLQHHPEGTRIMEALSDYHKENVVGNQRPQQTAQAETKAPPPADKQKPQKPSLWERLNGAPSS